MKSNKNIPLEVYQSRRYFDRICSFMFSEFIPESKWKILNELKLSVYPIIMFYMVYCIIYSLFVGEATSSPTKLSYLIVYFGGGYQALAKYILYRIHMEDLEEIRNFMTNLKGSLKDSDMISDIRREQLPKALQFSIRFVKSFLATSMIGGHFIFVSNSFSTNFECPLMFQLAHIPLSHDTWQYRVLSTGFHYICFIVLIIVLVGPDLILSIMVGYIDGELRTIKEVVGKLNDPEVARKQSNEILRSTYFLHIRINDIMTNLRNILWQMSIHILVSNFIFICMTFFITRFLSPSLVSVFSLMNVVFQLVIISINSQTLLNKTEEFADALWMTSWYEMCVKDQKIFLIILNMAQRRKGIEASGVSTISVNTLVQILKSSLTYAAFLYTLIT
ncbi:hypothetical protein DMENIID0001_091910 [Sergentomyia squamirostris]